MDIKKVLEKIDEMTVHKHHPVQEIKEAEWDYNPFKDGSAQDYGYEGDDEAAKSEILRLWNKEGFDIPEIVQYFQKHDPDVSEEFITNVIDTYEAEDEWEEDYIDDQYYDEYGDIDFARPGSGSALRAATDDNPRDRPCPTCGREDVLTRKDVQLGYQCDRCADAMERGHDIYETKNKKSFKDYIAETQENIDETVRLGYKTQAGKFQEPRDQASRNMLANKVKSIRSSARKANTAKLQAHSKYDDPESVPSPTLLPTAGLASIAQNPAAGKLNIRVATTSKQDKEKTPSLYVPGVSSGKGKKRTNEQMQSPPRPIPLVTSPSQTSSSETVVLRTKGATQADRALQQTVDAAARSGQIVAVAPTGQQTSTTPQTGQQSGTTQQTGQQVQETMGNKPLMSFMTSDSDESMDYTRTADVWQDGDEFVVIFSTQAPGADAPKPFRTSDAQQAEQLARKFTGNEKMKNINEKITKKTPAGKIIKDFQKSKDPKFKGKSQESVAEGSSKTKNEYGIDFKDIKVGDKVVLEDGDILTVISKTRFRNGMLALKVKDKSKDEGWSLANFLEVKKVRKSVAEGSTAKSSRLAKLANEIIEAIKRDYADQGMDYDDDIDLRDLLNDSFPDESFTAKVNELSLSDEKKVAAIVKREVNKHFGGQDDVKDARSRGLMRGWLRENVEESGLQAYLGKKKYGKAGMKALQNAGREGAGKEKMAKLRAKYDKVDEAERPSDQADFGAGLGAGRRRTTLEAKKMTPERAKPTPGSVEHLASLIRRAIKHNEAEHAAYMRRGATDSPARQRMARHDSELENINKEAAKYFGDLKDGDGTPLNKSIGLSHYVSREYGPPLQQAKDWMNKLGKSKTQNEETYQQGDVTEGTKGKKHTAVKQDKKAEQAGKKVAKEIEYDEKVKDSIRGKKRHSQDEKAEKAGKKITKDLEYEMKKSTRKKVKESMDSRLKAAYQEGLAHGLREQACRVKHYEDMEEARKYYQGYKEGLDECYGMSSAPIQGLVDEDMPATVPGMADQAMEGNSIPFMQEDELGEEVLMDAELDEMIRDLDEMNRTEYMQHRARTTPGDTFTAFGQEFKDTEVLEDDFMFESLDKQLNALLKSEETVTEGLSVSMSTGQPGMQGDSVSVTATDDDAAKLLDFVKKVALGGMQDAESSESPVAVVAHSDYGAPAHSHDNEQSGMLALVKKMSGGDYEHEDSSHADHEENHMQPCNECGMYESKCECEKEKVDEVQSEDQMTYEVAEDAAEDAEEAETTADENAEAEEDKALAMKNIQEEEYGPPRSKTIYTGPEGTLWRVSDADTWKKVASGTKWDVDMIKRYLGKGPVYVLAVPTVNKYAVHFPTETAIDSMNRKIDPEMLKKIKKLVSGAGGGGMNMNIYTEETNEGVGQMFNKGIKRDSSVLLVPFDVVGETFAVNAEDQQGLKELSAALKEFGMPAQRIWVNDMNPGKVNIQMPSETHAKRAEQMFHKLLKKPIYNEESEENLNEWANDAGKKGTDEAFTQDINFMTKVISGGLNKPKSTGQTTIPVVAGQKSRMGADSLAEAEDPLAQWQKLSGIK